MDKQHPTWRTHDWCDHHRHAVKRPNGLLLTPWSHRVLSNPGQKSRDWRYYTPSQRAAFEAWARPDSDRTA